MQDKPSPNPDDSGFLFPEDQAEGIDIKSQSAEPVEPSKAELEAEAQSERLAPADSNPKPEPEPHEEVEPEGNFLADDFASDEDDFLILDEEEPEEFDEPEESDFLQEDLSEDHLPEDEDLRSLGESIEGQNPLVSEPSKQGEPVERQDAEDSLKQEAELELAPEAKVELEPEAELAAEPAPAAESKSEPEPEPEPESEPKPEAALEAEPEPAAEPYADLEANSGSDSELDDLENLDLNLETSKLPQRKETASGSTREQPSTSSQRILESANLAQGLEQDLEKKLENSPTSQKPQGTHKENARQQLKNEGSSRRVLIIVGSIIAALIVIWIVLPLVLALVGSELISKEPAADLEGNQLNLPAIGTMVHITQVESGWRHETRELRGGKTVEIIVPELRFELEKMSDAPDGALRILFANNLGKLSSDPFNPVVSQGLIVDGEDLVGGLAVTGTDGLSDENDLVLQTIRSGMRWNASIYEGPHPKAPFSDFNLLLEVPILPTMLEQDLPDSHE